MADPSSLHQARNRDELPAARHSPWNVEAAQFGLGLPAGGIFLKPARITGIAVVPPLLGFNAGVELGQLDDTAYVVPLIGLARAAQFLREDAASLIASTGCIWLLQRV